MNESSNRPTMPKAYQAIDILNIRDRFRGFRRRTVFRLLALGTQKDLVGPGRRLIVAAHPDDETFGTGGLIASPQRSDTGVTQSTAVIFVTSGGAAHRSCCSIAPFEVQEAREATARKVSRLLGIGESELHFMHESDGHLPQPGQSEFDCLSLRLAALISEINPTQIFTHHPLDGHPDHLAVEQLTRTALRGLQLQATLFHYCVWLWYSLPVSKTFSLSWKHANLFDISAARSTKHEAIQIYLQDLAPCGNPYCGILPHGFLDAFGWKNELFFRVPRAHW